MIGTRARVVVAMLGLVGSGVVGATSSDAVIGPECVGIAQAAVCVTIDPAGLPGVNPTGGPGIHECVFLGPPPCTPVDVPTPSISSGSGSPLVVQCVGAVPCVDTVTTVGSGVFRPGIFTSSCTVQTGVYFSSTLLVVAGDETDVAGAVQFEGSSDTCETLTSGHGSGTLSGAASGLVTYSRTGSVVTITGNSVTVNGETGNLNASCLFLPTTYNPVDTFTLVCTGTVTS